MRRYPLAALIFVVGLSFGLAWLVAAAEPSGPPQSGESKTEAENPPAETPTDKPSQASAPPSSQESLDVRYARAALELARLEVARVEEANRKVPATYAEATIEPLRQIVVLSEAQLEAALSKPGTPASRLNVRRAETRLRVAQSDQARGAAMNRSLPGMVSPLGMKRLAAAVNLARLGLEKARTEPGPPTLAQLEWRLNELEKDVLQLRSRMDQASTSGGTLEWWPYWSR